MTKKPRTPRQKYHAHRADARIRGIGWEFTFQQWFDVWTDSGKWDQRGCRKGQYVMARRGDVGPYSPTNVEIKTVEQNCSENHQVVKRPGTIANLMKHWARNGNYPAAPKPRRRIILTAEQRRNAEAAYSRKYYTKNKQRVLDRAREYHRANRDKILSRQKRRREWKRALGLVTSEGSSSQHELQDTLADRGRSDQPQACSSAILPG